MEETPKADKVQESVEKMVADPVKENIEQFQNDLQEWGDKVGKVRETVQTVCYCGEPIPTDLVGTDEVSPSMYYWKRRTCSRVCHNKWILGLFEGLSKPVGPGWMPIVEKLNDDIMKLDPNYRIVQIKEKFGGLRYYTEFTEPELPLGITDEEVWALQGAVSNLYYELQKLDDPEGMLGEGVEKPDVPEWKEKRMREDCKRLRSMVKKLRPIQALIDEAEELTYKTCEACSEPAESNSIGGWVSTLCPEHTKMREDGKRIWEIMEDGTSQTS